MDGISQRIKEHVRVHTYYTPQYSGLELNLDKELKTFVTARIKQLVKLRFITTVSCFSLMENHNTNVKRFIFTKKCLNITKRCPKEN